MFAARKKKRGPPPLLSMLHMCGRPSHGTRTVQSLHAFVYKTLAKLDLRHCVCTTSCCERSISICECSSNEQDCTVFQMRTLAFCEVESTKLRKRKQNLRSFALSPSQLINILASSFYQIADIVNLNNGYKYLWTGSALPSPFSLKICLCYVMFLKVWLCSFKKCKECVYS